jgi:thioredoxin-dependent peroxiredoxin
MSKPTLQKQAPSIKTTCITNQNPQGIPFDLTEQKNHYTLLYFYPKDDTPGCTKQACAIRDQWNNLPKNLKIFGVSPDPIKAHQKFITKYELPFGLLLDEDKAIATAYGVWVEKSMYGKKYMGNERTSFLISPEGKLLQIFEKVKPEEHLELVLKSLP